MPAHYLLKVAMHLDSALPRDAVVIDPCFRIQVVSGEGDPQTLCDDLATALNAKIPTTPFDVTAYELEGPPPHYPKGQTKKNVASPPPASNFPREVALCLSFYGSHNVPTERGRLYLPPAFYGTPAGARPSGSLQTNALTLVPIFANLGGTNVDWIVWSRKLQKATRVENAYVDDEWDTVRTRGLKPTTRTLVSTSG